MNFSTYRFTLDLQKHQSQMSIAAFQYDTAVKLSIGLTDGGVPYYLEDGCIAVLWGKKANGEPISHKCSIESNTKIIYEFNKETADEIGVVDCQIRLYKDGEEIISAPKFIIVVAERVVNDAEVFDAGDGAFEEQFSALDDLFIQESGRRIAENARVEAEKERQGNELLRKEKELSRIEFETQRQTDEVKRVKAEEERTEAEDARVEAEKLRQVQYDNIENIMYKATEGLSYTLSSDGTYYEVSGIGTATDTDIVMPMFYEDLPVKSISENAFENNTKINSITIPESITYIGNYAFSGCTKLTKINFNAIQMKSNWENNYVFSNAGKDSTGINVTVGKNVTKIPSYLFSPHYENMSIAPNIKTVVFEDGCVCKEIGQRAFWMCRNLTDISFPMGLTTIGYGAFGFTSLTNVKLPNTLKSLWGNAFYCCYSLLSILLPKSVTSVGGNSFMRCTKLTIYCEAETQPADWDTEWNSDGCPVVWGVPLDFPSVNNKLEEYKSESKEYADGIKDDLLNGAGPAYDTLKELGDALEKNKDIIEVIKEASENKVNKTNLANRLYGTKSDKSQTVYLLDKNATANSVPQRTPTGQLRVALTPENDNEATSKKFVADFVNPIADRVTELESLTLTRIYDTSTAYEKAVPAEVGKSATIKMIGGATKKVSLTKNILDPKTLSFWSHDSEAGISYTLNADGTITYTIAWGGFCSFGLHNFPVGRYCLYLENASIDYDYEGNIDLALSSDYDPESGNTEPTTKTLKVMLWLDESVTTENYEIREVDSAVFEPYVPILQDAEVERIESIGADGETLLDSITIPEAVRELKMVTDTYRDYIECIDDKKFKHEVVEKMVLNGSEKWIKANGANPYFYITTGYRFVVKNILCPIYEHVSLSVSNTLIGIQIGGLSATQGEPCIIIRPVDYATMTVDDFKAQLAEKPLTVRLARVEPIVTDITDLFTEDNLIEVQGGGALRFVNEHKMPVPSNIVYVTGKE